MWKELGILATGVILGSVPFLIRSLWGHTLSKRLADYEGKLAKQLENYKGELAKDFERFKTSLSTEVFERQTKYEWLHTKRAKVLVELYRLLSKVDRSCNRVIFATALAIKGELRVDVAESELRKSKEGFQDFLLHILENQVFLNPSMVRQLGTLNEKYEALLGLRDANPPPTDPPVETMIRLKKDIAPLLEEIQRTVQEMLGVE